MSGASIDLHALEIMVPNPVNLLNSKISSLHGIIWAHNLLNVSK